jgi:hypothetical protein
MPEKHPNIPAQHKGAESNYTHKVTLPDIPKAKSLFNTAKNRLLNVSEWEKISKGLSADFQLTDRNGQKVNRPAEEGDYFKIDIPAPGTTTGEGHDWVEVESILHESRPEEEYESVSMRVRPAPNPQNKDPDTAHFFKRDATSTFMVIRKGASLSAEVHGRNESPNTGTKNVWNIIRNMLVALGAISGFARPQWKGLIKGLLVVSE